MERKLPKTGGFLRFLKVYKLERNRKDNFDKKYYNVGKAVEGSNGA